jgi:hypothetical protein
VKHWIVSNDLVGWLLVAAVLCVLFLAIEGGLYGWSLDRQDKRRRRPTLLDVLSRREPR